MQTGTSIAHMVEFFIGWLQRVPCSTCVYYGTGRRYSSSRRVLRYKTTVYTYTFIIGRKSTNCSTIPNIIAVSLLTNNPCMFELHSSKRGSSWSRSYGS